MRQWKWIKLKLVSLAHSSQLTAEFLQWFYSIKSDYFTKRCLSLSMSAVTWSNFYWNLPSDPGLRPVLSPHHIREMTEYSSDEEDRRGHNSSDLTPDDFDFDISSYTNQSSFFRSQIPVENKKTERHRSKTDSRNNSKVKEAKMSAVIVGGEGSKISCRICGDTAVKHVHYGGHCCFSCKAFFRRAVNWQNKNNRTFQCKFENKCEITIKNRKTCQSCRFQVIRAFRAQSDMIWFVFFRKDKDFTNYLFYAKHSQNWHKCVLYTGTGQWTDWDMIFFFIEKFSLSLLVHSRKQMITTVFWVILISRDKRQIKLSHWRKYSVIQW